MDWTPANIEMLTRLWNEGVSCAWIAARMETTKNSIIGKANRLNLPPRTTTVRAPCTYSHKPRPPRRPVTLPTLAKVIPLRPVAVLRAPEGPGVSIVDLTGCKYAIGFDADAPGRHLFCNHGRDENSPWCAYHHDLILYKPEKGKARKRFRIPTSLLRAG